MSKVVMGGPPPRPCPQCKGKRVVVVIDPLTRKPVERPCPVCGGRAPAGSGLVTK